MKRVSIFFLCGILAGCATGTVQTADSCKVNGGVASGGTSMMASGNLAAGLVGLAVLGAAKLAHDTCERDRT